MAVATLGIISIGDMGLGVAKLLIANGYNVITNVAGRSQATQDRAKNNGIGLVPTDVDLCNTAHYILSIVPPRDAIATAQRIITASQEPTFQPPDQPIYYVDLNAISPRSAREIDNLFARAPHFRYLDGGIIGGPPRRNEDDATTWDCPSIPVSGPHRLSDATPRGEQLAALLHVQHVNATIGAASGLKMCFAALSKGFTALAIQSFTTAQALGVGDELRAHLDAFSPGVRARAERGVVSMPPKAYRWVHEMRQIAETFEAEGGFAAEESPFRAVARVYELVAEGTDLGAEVTGRRKRGRDAEDVARLMLEGTERRKRMKD